MSNIRGEVIRYRDEDGDHEMQVIAHLTSDTVSIRLDGEVEMVVSDEGYAALLEAMAALEAVWK